MDMKTAKKTVVTLSNMYFAQVMVHASFSCHGLQNLSQMGHMVVLAMLPVHTSLDMRLNMAVMTSYMDTVSWLTVNHPYRKQKMPT